MGNYALYGSGVWGTQDELRYLNTIGEHKKTSKEGMESVWDKLSGAGRKEWKIKMLEGYLTGARKRVNWGRINSNDVINYAEQELHLKNGGKIGEEIKT